MTQSSDQLLPLLYDELRRLALHKMSVEKPNHTLQPTALVHEAWLRLEANGQQKWNGRAHFFAAAAEAMRRILIESARRKQAVRHGGRREHLDIQEFEIAADIKEDDLFAVNEALERFAERDPEKAELVKLRYFVGMTLEEAAEVLGISTARAKRHWTFARAWLYREIDSHQKENR